MKMHQKGFLLVELGHVKDMWDYSLIEIAQQEYGLPGTDAANTFHVALNELAAAGLIVRVEEKLVNDPASVGKVRVAFRYRLSDFGRERMLETGLLTVADADCVVG